MSKKIRKRQIKKSHDFYVSEYQAFDLFVFQAKFIAAGLRTFIRMKRNSVGPNNIYEYFCKRAGTTAIAFGKEAEAKHEIAEQQSIRYWEAVLRRMYYAFDQIANDYPDAPYNVWFHEENKEFQKTGLPFFEKGTKNPDGTITMGPSNFPDCPESVLKKNRLYHRKIDKGVRLYARYFEALWD